MIEGKDVEKLAELARIEVPKEEVSSLAGEIDSILGYVEQVQKVGSVDLESQSAVKNIMREDGSPHESGEFTKEIVDLAPDKEGNYIKVKKIL